MIFQSFAILEPDVIGRRWQLGGVGGELAVRELLVAANDEAVLGAKVGGGDLPALGRRLDQHELRALAPTLRRRSNSDHVLVEPPVPCRCRRARARRPGAAGACSTRIFAQSASSSSAMSIGRAVQTPCPISEWLRRTVTVSSVPMRRNAFTGIVAGAASAAAASANTRRALRGSTNPRTRPPAPASRNSRRVTFTVCPRRSAPPARPPRGCVRRSRSDRGSPSWPRRSRRRRGWAWRR